jgi:predicted glycosyltransferase
VSQCGYNTALDLIRAGIPAVVAPLVEDGDEEPRRAGRLAELGLVSVVGRDELDGPHLAAAILAARDTPPATSAIELDGANRSVEILAEYEHTLAVR